MGRAEQLESSGGSRWWLAVVVIVVTAVLVAAGVRAYASRIDPPPVPITPTSSPEEPSPSPSPRALASPGEDTSRTAEQNLLYRWQFAEGFTCAGFVKRDRVPRGERMAYLQSLVECLGSLHEPPMRWLRRQDATQPRLVLEGQDPMQICRGSEHADWGANYCVTNKTITFRLLPQSRFDENPAADEFLIAHEYAHHLQAISGIWVDAGVEFEGDEALGRRIELQATCMAGAMVTGNWSPIRRSREVQQRHLDDLGRWPADWATTHGGAEARRVWARAGMTGPGYAGCNTWSAPDQRVR